METDEERIRKEAHKLWEAEGRPDGRSERHWAEAREIVALKDSMGSTLKPLKETIEDVEEPTLAADNLGDLPGLTDQGDEVLAPSREAARAIADEEPLVTDKDARKSKGKPKAAAKSKQAAPAAASKPAAKAKDKAASEKTKGKEKTAPKRKSA